MDFYGAPHSFFSELENNLGAAGLRSPGAFSPEEAELPDQTGQDKCLQGADTGPRNKHLTIFLKSESSHEKDAVEFNKVAVKNGVNCLYVDLTIGGFGVVGPLVIPPETPCYDCFLERRLINGDSVAAHALSNAKVLKPGKVTLYPWQITLMSSLVCQEVITYFVKGFASSCRKIIHVDLSKMEIWRESLLRYPVCRVCGDFQSRFSKNQGRLQEVGRKELSHALQ